MFQPKEYMPRPDQMPRDVAELVRLYDVTPSGDPLVDITATTLLYRVDMPGTDDAVIELTSGRYDGLRFSGLTGTRLKDKPVPPRGDGG